VLQVSRVPGGQDARTPDVYIRTFLTTPLSFLGAAFFLVTPVGFAAAFLVAGAALVVLGLVLVRLTAGAVSTTGKTRGLELPVAERVPSRAISIVRVGFIGWLYPSACRIDHDTVWSAIGATGDTRRRNTARCARTLAAICASSSRACRLTYQLEMIK